MNNFQLSEVQKNKTNDVKLFQVNYIAGLSHPAPLDKYLIFPLTACIKFSEQRAQPLYLAQVQKTINIFLPVEFYKLLHVLSCSENRVHLGILIRTEKFYPLIVRYCLRYRMFSN